MNHRRQIVWQLAGPLLPVALLWGHAALTWSYTSVETGTVLSYARTLAAGEGFALSPGAVAGHGFSSLLWVLLLALAQVGGLPLLAVAKVAGLLLASGALLLLPRVGAALACRRAVRPLDLVPALLLAVHPALGRHAAGGLETALVLFLLAWGCLLYVREEARFTQDGDPRGMASLIPMALLLLARPEAPLWVGALMVGRVLSRVTARRFSRSLMVWLAVPTLTLGMVLLWSTVTFAQPWPGMLAARQALTEARLGSGEAVAVGWHCVGTLWRQWGITLPLLTVALVGAVRATLYWARISLLGLTAACLAAVLLMGGDGSGRLALLHLLPLLILVGDGLSWIIRTAWPPTVRPWLRWTGGAALTLGLAAPPVIAGARSLRVEPSSPFDSEMQLGLLLREEVERLGWAAGQVRVLTDRPGVMAVLGFEVVDITGRTDSSIGRLVARRRVRQLQQLVFSERQPDLLVERAPYRGLWGLSRFPEADRQYIPLRLDDHHASSLPRVMLSRRLLLEAVPWSDRPVRLRLGDHLWLMGFRAMPGQLVLVWTSDRNRPRAMTVRIGLGRLGGAGVAVGPAVYPMSAWRAGELVRQVIPMRNLDLRGRHSLWIDAGRGPVEVGEVDTRQLHLFPTRAHHQRMEAAIRRDDWDRVDALMTLDRNHGIELPRVRRWYTERIEVLMERGLLDHAGRQLQVIHPGPRPDDRLGSLAQRLAARSYHSARGAIRQSRWSLARTRLETSLKANPRSPLMVRLRDQARSRFPVTSRFMPTLELELARRAMVLDPSAEHLSRLMRALLKLDRARQAALAYQVWKEHVTPDPRCRYLLAKALARTGRLKRALMLTEEVLDASPSSAPARSMSRRCPPWHVLHPEVLRAQLLQILALPQAQDPPERLFAGDPIRLGRHSTLLAHCARWEPGAPAEVVLYIWQPKPEELLLELGYGSRRRRLGIPGSPVVLRRVAVPTYLPPASYPVQLVTRDGRRIDLGMLDVGAEANLGFEVSSYASWHRQGQAFGAAPVAGRGARWRAVHGFVGDYFADSRGSDLHQAVGTLTSPAFQLRRGHLMLLVAGGDDPTLGVDLLVDERPVFTVRGNRSAFFRPVFLPVARYHGQWARLVIRDGNRADRWGYLAVDEIRQLDGPAVGVAP